MSVKQYQQSIKKKKKKVPQCSIHLLRPWPRARRRVGVSPVIASASWEPGPGGSLPIPVAKGSWDERHGACVNERRHDYCNLRRGPQPEIIRGINGQIGWVRGLWDCSFFCLLSCESLLFSM